MPRPPLWRTPRCGQRFVSPNLPHSCPVVDLAAHFAASEPHVRPRFGAFVAAAGRRGDVLVNATRSRISIQGRMRLAGVQRPRRSSLVAGFLLTRPVRSRRFVRVDDVPP